jgi:glycosyltransferase involved in cell wall biosynthesis
MTDTPTVTVLVPTWNRAELIGEAIRSILVQTFTDFEVIVVDDGSTDATADALARLSDSRLRVLHRDHRGISAAMNAGLSLARGRYIARLDSDDVWRPDLLGTLVPLLDSQPEIDVVYAQADALDHGVVVGHLQGMPLRFPDDSLRSLVYDDCTCNVALVARRACLDRAGPYDETLIANEDWDMWLRVARQSRFAFCDQVLARIRWHPGNLTGLESPQLAQVLASRMAPLDKLFAQPDLPESVVALRSTAYANVHLFNGLRWLQAGYHRAALKEFLQVVRHSDRPVLATARVVWRAAIRPPLERWPHGRAVAKRVAAFYRRLG